MLSEASWEYRAQCALGASEKMRNNIATNQSFFIILRTRKNGVLQGGTSLWTCLLDFCLIETIYFPLRLFIATV